MCVREREKERQRKRERERRLCSNLDMTPCVVADSLKRVQLEDEQISLRKQRPHTHTHARTHTEDVMQHKHGPAAVLTSLS